MPKPITITISGCPYSGKTTLVSFLSSILPVAFSVQQDDFEMPNSITESHQPSDLYDSSSFDLNALELVIQRSQETGDMPPAVNNANHDETTNLITEETRNLLQERLIAAIGPHKIGLVEGRTLHQDPGLLAGADVRLFLRASKTAARGHRGSLAVKKKSEDADDSFDDSVWPDYVRESAFLFNGDDVEGTPNSTICNLMDLSVQPKLDNSIEETLKWAVDSICFISERE